ncbi:MAG: hypothetical protein J6Q48_01725 [Bacteroidaceae bacterium]|nr:hypothetical protein [Bacteroidaceae bacterium]
MSNELKDIVNRLNGYSDDGWVVTSAEKLGNGGWRLDLQPLVKEPEAEMQEATDDNN